MKKSLLLVIVAFISLTCARFWKPELDKQLDYLQLADCPYQVEPVGCYNDRGHKHRAMKHQILNSRDTLSKVFHSPAIQWHNFNHWLANFICKGAEKLFEKKPTAFSDYIGLQFYGEVWANLDSKHQTEYNTHGASNRCIDGDYKNLKDGHIPQTCGLFVGGPQTNYIYKVTRYNNKTAATCPYFESRGCWIDGKPRAKPEERPMKIYKMNERDPRASNWNGNLINWKQWGRGYLGDLICRCAELAKKDKMRFFSIQFYGECWLSNNEEFEQYGKKKDGCVDNKYDSCPAEQGTKCRARLCAGKWEENKVYELKQGPDMCASNPCKYHSKCLTIGSIDYVCQCAPGYTGTHCENEPILSK